MNQLHTSRMVSVTSLVLLLGGVALFAPQAVSRQAALRFERVRCHDGRVPIRSLPFTIGECGSYFLTGCLTGSSGAAGITIDADDVTLDLNGFTLVGAPGSTEGIVVVPGRTNVTLGNGTVRGWGGAGIDASGATDSLLAGLRSSGNGGLGLAVGTGGIVRYCASSNNAGDGISVGFGARVSDSTSNGNGVNGIVAQFAATVTGSVIEGCTARGNSFVGILAGDGSTVTDCSVTQNGTGGISVGFGCTVEGCAAARNGEDGINAFDSLVRGNSSRGNLGAQINAPASTVIENHN